MSDSCNPIDCSPPGSSVHRISQEYWSGLPFPAPGDLLDPEMEPRSPALAGRFFTTEPPGSSGFCHTATWISHMYTYIPSLLNLPPTCRPIPPLHVIAEHWVELPGSWTPWTQQLPADCFTHGNAYSMLLCQFVPPSPFPTGDTSS